MNKCKTNDLIYVKNLDRLGVSYEQLRENWLDITLRNGVNVCVIDSPMIDTRRGKELVSDVVLSVLTYVSKTAKTGSSEIVFVTEVLGNPFQGARMAKLCSL